MTNKPIEIKEGDRVRMALDDGGAIEFDLVLRIEGQCRYVEKRNWAHFPPPKWVEVSYQEAIIALKTWKKAEATFQVDAVTYVWKPICFKPPRGIADPRLLWEEGDIVVSITETRKFRILER